jgi:segregation and condensation protein B
VQEMELPSRPVQLSEKSTKPTSETAGSHTVASTEPPGQASLSLLLEGVLFVAAEPIQVARLAQLLDVSQEAIDIALADMAVAYRTQQRGVRLLRRGDRVQLTSAPEAAPYVERFLDLDLTSKLSPAALETLAVIAYKQPLTRGDMEGVRGVNCDGVVRTLLARELIEPVGRLDQPGRPFLYGTTTRFLQYMGLESLQDLPPLPEPAV